ncbi:hypothetical protein CASFOL_017806 [Castilleja foliolosa]|uniref:Transposase, Ptta/En/Spm, plant n=1 Tax=Castilleja foliolosa TaxID=1961234 RepID=A0ABD3D806_9LAMI
MNFIKAAMDYPLSRFTRSACARLAAARKEKDDGGEPSAPRHPRPVKRDGNKWAFALLDGSVSKRIGVEPTKELLVEVEEMAPGGVAANQKSRFARNHTTLNSTARRNPRVQSDKLNVPSLNESTHMPTSNNVLSKQPIETDTHAPQSQSSSHRTLPASQKKQSLTTQPQSANTQTQSSGQRTQSSSQQNKSVGNQSQSVNTDTQSCNHQTQSNSPQSQSTGRKTQSSSPENQSNTSQRQLGARQTQPIPPQPESAAALHNEANIPLTKSIDTIQRGLRDETDDTNDTNDTNDTDDTDETAAVSRVEKRKRGPTMGRGLMKALGGSKGKKMKIEVDPAIGRPKNRVESAKFSSQVGVVARDVLPVPRKWKEINVQNALNPCIDHMQIHMDVNMDKPGVRQCVIDRLKNSSRQQRYRLHQHYKRFANVQEAKRNKPNTVSDQEQWELLCDHFDSPEFKNQSQANSNNRKKMRAKHITGRTPFTIIQNEISDQKGDDCDMIELYKSTHENVNGKWSSDVAKENWELMMEKKEKYAEEGIEKSEQEIVTEVLGHANGYIKGLGYGPKPPGKRNSQLHQELEETRAELEESRSDKAAYKSKVDAMTEQLQEQAAQIAKLMAFMEAGGRNAAGGHTHVDDDQEVDEDLQASDYSN